MKTMINVVIATTILLFITSTTWAASTKDEVLKLQEQVTAMQKDLEEIKQLLKKGGRAAPPAPVFAAQDIEIGPSPFLGKADATVTLIEYSDYQCPYCARHYKNVLPALIAEYIDTGKLKYVMRENPIPALHRQATNASLAALCAGDQDQYWSMHNILFDNQKTLTFESMKGLAATMGLDTTAFNACMDERKFQKQINADLASGAKLGIRGTPGFVIGLTDPGDPNKAHLTLFMNGAQSLTNFKRNIDSLLTTGK